jgi:O-antigen/teichoic acid export membrane protein
MGPDLLRMMTASEFAVPSAVLMILATGRFVQGLSFLLQAVFSVHQRVGASMACRALGAVITVPLCVVGVKRLGLVGAAIGSTVAIVLYAALLIFGPSGCFWLIRDARHGAMQQAATPLHEPVGASEAAA